MRLNLSSSQGLTRKPNKKKIPALISGDTNVFEVASRRVGEKLITYQPQQTNSDCLKW